MIAHILPRFRSRIAFAKSRTAWDLNHHGRRFLPRVIRQLAKRGEIEEMYGGRYRLAGSKTGEPRQAFSHCGRSRKKSANAAADCEQDSRHRMREASPQPNRHRNPRRSAGTIPSLISGRLVAHRDGYGFVVPDKPIPRVDGDLFIGRDNLADAMHGDRVLARVERRRADGRAEGRIVQIVEREHPTLVGLFRYGPHGNHVLPYDTRIPHEVLIPPGDELTPANGSRKTRRDGDAELPPHCNAACACRSSTAPS